MRAHMPYMYTRTYKHTNNHTKKWKHTMTVYQIAIPSGEFPTLVSLFLVRGASSWDGGLLWLDTEVSAKKKTAYTGHTHAAVDLY